MLQTRIPPPIYALVAGLGMWLLDAYLPLLEVLSSPWNRLGLGVILIAGLADLWSLGLFFRARTTPNPMQPQRSSSLVTEGLYGYTRNPMYVGLLLMLCGWAIYLGSLSPLLMLPLFVWVINHQQIFPEEAVLSEKFGDSYQRYRQSVPRWLW